MTKIDDKTIAIGEHKTFAMNSVTSNAMKVSQTNVSSSRKDIRSSSSNPLKNSVKIQKLSRATRMTNGIYARLINYFGNIYTYDHTIYPISVNSGNIKEEYLRAAKKVEKYNLRFNLPWIAEKTIEQGEVFLYKIEDNNSVIYFEFPTEACRVSCIENGVLRYEIDLRTLSKKDYLDILPTDIVAIITKFKNGSIPKEHLDEGKWYQLDSKGVAFSTTVNAEKGYPLLNFLLSDLSHLEAIKELQFDSALLENLKLIHQKIPIDKNTGEVLIDIDVIQAYHESTKKNLPSSVAITTNPLDVNVLTMSSGSNRQIVNQVADAKANTYDSAGVNAEIFNGSKSSNEAIASGLIADSMMVTFLLKSFENYINSEFIGDKRVSNWRVRLLDTTQFNREKKVKLSRENMAYGGSRTEFLAHNGYSPLQAMNILEMEQALGFDGLLVPQQTSHTLSSDEAEKITDSETVGRSNKEDSDTDDLSDQPRDTE